MWKISRFNVKLHPWLSRWWSDWFWRAWVCIVPVSWVCWIDYTKSDRTSLTHWVWYKKPPYPCAVAITTSAGDWRSNQKIIPIFPSFRNWLNRGTLTFSLYLDIPIVSSCKCHTAFRLLILLTFMACYWSGRSFTRRQLNARVMHSSAFGRFLYPTFE